MDQRAEIERRQLEENAKKFFVFTGINKCPENAIFILVLGMTGSGKSSFISVCTGKSASVGHGLQSCTSDIDIYDFEIDGKRVYLVDTPGFNDTNRSDTETLRVLATYLTASYMQRVHIHGIIYMHSIADNRMTGSSKRNVEMFKALCGYATYDNVAIATTFWNSRDRKTFIQRENELRKSPEFFGEVISEGARLFRHCDTGQDASHFRQSARSIVRAVIAQSWSPVTLLIQHELVEERKSLLQTSAGIALAGEINKIVEDCNRELASLKEEMDKAIRRGQESHCAELQDVKKEYEKQLRSMRRKQRTLALDIEQMHAREKEVLLDKLAATEKRYHWELEQHKAELQAMKESLALTQHEIAHQRSTSHRQALQQDLMRQENQVSQAETRVANEERAYNNLSNTTKGLKEAVVSGLVGSVASAVLTGGLVCVVQ